MNLAPLQARLIEAQRQQQDYRRVMKAKSRRRWIRKPTRVTQDRYLRLVAAAEDGTLDDAGALELGRLSRRLTNAAKTRVERKGQQLGMVL